VLPDAPLTRRGFLKILGGLAGAAMLTPLTRLAASPLSLNVPPTLVFHTKDRWQMPRLLKWLNTNGYQSINYQTLADVIQGQATLPDKPILITIDDIGSSYIQPYFLDMADMVENAGYRGVFAVVTRQSPAKNPKAWAVLRQLADRGWEMDTHTTHHVVLPSLKTVDELRAEIVDSAQMLEDGIGHRPVSLIIPYANLYEKGRHVDQRIFDVASEAGLTFVVGMVEGRQIAGNTQPPYYVGRVGIGVDAIQTTWWITHFNGATS
jgi:peptidoglycan/xylan/chitin deacetylase (PgdA/CDA1 family)